MHGFRNAIEGPILQVPGSSVRLDAQVDTLWAGVNIKFGRSTAERPASDARRRSVTPRRPLTDSVPFVMPPPPPDAMGIPSAPAGVAGSSTSELPPLPPPEPSE